MPTSARNSGGSRSCGPTPCPQSRHQSNRRSVNRKSRQLWTNSLRRTAEHRDTSDSLQCGGGQILGLKIVPRALTCALSETLGLSPVRPACRAGLGFEARHFHRKLPLGRRDIRPETALRSVQFGRRSLCGLTPTHLSTPVVLKLGYPESADQLPPPGDGH
jgi:hypothetical protein